MNGIDVVPMDGRTRRLKTSIQSVTAELQTAMKAISFCEELMCYGDRNKKKTLEDSCMR